MAAQRPALPPQFKGAAQAAQLPELARFAVEFSTAVFKYLKGFAAEYDEAQGGEQARILARASLRG